MLKGKSRARIGKSVQRYFPQCAACCSKQAAAVRSNATRLVLHFYGMRPWYYAGEQMPNTQGCSQVSTTPGAVILSPSSAALFPGCQAPISHPSLIPQQYMMPLVRYGCVH